MLTRGYELVHQAMGAEAKATVWEAESLARRYGHGRVTPLHLASAMLSSTPASRSLLLPSSAQQLWQEKLGPCFDAALSRLPVASPPPHAAILAPPLPMSNALVTALKRAHLRSSGGWRRGWRPHLAAAKIELEHLVVAIMDDPTVYRAMEKKPCSSSGVKPNLVEKGESLEQTNQVRVVGPLASNLSSHSSGDHPTSAKTADRLEPFVAQSAATAILPSCHRHHQDVILRCRSTTLRATCYQRKFTELSATNFKIMCDALVLRVPQHKDITASIASTVLWCRSGMMRRANRSASSTTWLFFHGPDGYGKKDMAREISNLIFGSYSVLSLLNSGDSSGTCNRANKRKRSRDGDDTYVMRRLLEAIQDNPHRVVLIDGINQLDYESKIAIKNFIATGKVMGCNDNDMVNLEDAIIVLSTDETSSSRTKALSTLLTREYINTLTRKDKGVESRRFILDEDVGEKQNLVGENVGIESVADGVFHFN